MSQEYGVTITDGEVTVTYDDAYEYGISIADEDGSIIYLTEAQYKWLLSRNILTQGKEA